MKILKRRSAFLLTLALSIAMLAASGNVYADTQIQKTDTDTVTVYLKVEDVDSTLISEQVTLTKNDLANICHTYMIESGDIEIPVLASDTLTAAHVLGKYIADTSSEPKKDLSFSYGCPAHIRGEKAVDYYPYWSFRVNNSSPSDEATGSEYTPTTYPVKDGDCIVFFRQACYDPNAGAWGAYTNYSWFDQNRYETTVNTPISISYSKDGGFGTDIQPAAGEPIAVYKQSQLIQTVDADENGIVRLSFDEAGTYTITGSRITNDLPENSHASAIIHVTASGDPTTMPFDTSCVWSGFRNEQGQTGANTTSAKTPILPENTSAKWQIKFEKEESIAYNSDPVITDANLYVVCKDTLYQLDKSGTICSTLTLAAPMNSVCRMTLHDNQLFIPLSGGTMQCVDIISMSSLWVSESFGVQSLSTVYYADGLLYAGTTNSSGREGMYYCLSAEDGSTQWTYQDTENPCGYYWSGAISGENFVLLGGDNGKLVSHSLTDNTVYDTCDLSVRTSSPGKIRSGITYDSETDAFYTTTNNGYLYQIKMSSDGTFKSITQVPLFSASAPYANCTSTPTIYNGRIYVCSYDALNGSRLNVIDAATMQLIYAASLPDCPDIKSSPLVSTASDSSGRVFVYFSPNALPGGIYYIEDDKTTEQAQIQTLFVPTDGAQFCLSSIAADSDGTLYYSNDSGTLFAVAEGAAAGSDTSLPSETTSPTTAPAEPPTETPASPPSATAPAPLPTNATSVRPVSVKKPKKPTHIRYRVKKIGKHTYQVTFSWKKGDGTSFTKLSIRRNKTVPRKTAFSRTYRTSARKISIKLKKGTYNIRFYGCKSATKKSGAVTRKLRLL